MQNKSELCSICGEPMPHGEEMFNYHGYSGPCPKPKSKEILELKAECAVLRQALEKIGASYYKKHNMSLKDWKRELLEGAIEFDTLIAKEALSSSTAGAELLDAIENAVAALENYSDRDNWYGHDDSGKALFHDGSDQNLGYDSADEALIILRKAIGEME